MAKDDRTEDTMADRVAARPVAEEEEEAQEHPLERDEGDDESEVLMADNNDIHNEENNNNNDINNDIRPVAGGNHGDNQAAAVWVRAAAQFFMANQQLLQQQQLQLLQQQQQQLDREMIVNPRHPGRMQLIGLELQWALTIKTSVEEDPDLENLNDFWYAQLAIMDQEDMESALDRVRHLQEFRHEYGIVNTAKEGSRYLHELVRLFPRHVLSFLFNHHDGNYVFIFDNCGLNKRLLSNSDNVVTYLKATYYAMNILNPDFETIRRGFTSLGECEGFDWAQNFDLKVYRRFWTEIINHYPTRIHLIKFFHTGMFFNLLYSMLRPLLPTYIRSRIQMGCIFEERLDAFYLVPTVEEANEKVLARMDEILKLRYDNEQKFSLPSSS